MHQYDAFVSYSRRDEELVKPVVKLLSVSNRRIFWDAQIAPGARWMDSIASALAASHTVIVIWCCHAAESHYVEAEVEATLRQDKLVVPVLVCPYPVREPLDEIQNVDFRDITRHVCTGDVHPPHGDTSQLAARDFEDPDAVSTVDMWRAVLKPQSAWRRLLVIGSITASLLTMPVIPPISIVSLLFWLSFAWGTGLFHDAPMTRASLRLAAVIETAIRRAEKRRLLLR